MANIKWGIIGPGNIAAKFAQALKEMNGVELVAVASRSKERSEVFGKAFDVLEHKCYGSYKEMVQDECIDAVYVAVPHTFHKEISIMCLKNGKAVLCEKPLAISEAEVKEIVRTAQENKRFFMEAMKTRFLPINRKVKEIVNEGQIGDLRLLQADFGFKAPFDPENRLFDKKLGGGALMDVGIYNVSYSSFIFGNQPESIRCDLYIGDTGVDLSGSINLNYVHGQQAQLYSAINVETRREANFLGTEGRICVPRYSNADTAIVYKNGEEKKLHIPFEINGFEYQIQEVVDCLNEGKLESEIMSWKDSIEIMRIMDSAEKLGRD